MSIAEFRKELDKAHGPGGQWRKADFHIHLPGSSDYQYKGGDATKLLADAINSTRREYAVILKHQEMPSRQELEALQGMTPNTTLIPGAEINVIVEALFKKVSKDHFFHCIVAVDPTQRMDFGFVLETAKKKFKYRPGDYPAGFETSIVELGRFFREEGALFIPAHLHQGKAADQSRSIDDIYDDDAFLRFLNDGAFSALEVRELATAKYFVGGKSTKEGLPIPQTVCVASSDAHHHDHVLADKRFTWVKTETKSFQELAAALSFSHRVSLTPPQSNHPAILGLHIVGAFLPDIWLSLNEGLNALIGGKGSGKTAILECLRFVLCTPVPAERVEDVRKHVGHILGTAGRVECLVRGGKGDHYLITRRSDSPDRIVVLDSAGEARTISASEGPGFPASILGWHEIEAVADKASARINLLDRVGDASAIKVLRETVRTHIERARDLLPLLQLAVKKLDSVLKELWELQRQRATLTKLEKDELTALQKQYEWFLGMEQRLDSLREAVVDRKASLPQRIANDLPSELVDAPDPANAQSTVEPLADLKQRLQESIKKEGGSVAEVNGALDAVSMSIEKAVGALAESFRVFRESVYAPKVNELAPEEKAILTRQIQVLEETKRLPTVEQQSAELLKDVRKNARELFDLADAVCKVRDDVAGRRAELVKKLNEELSTVKLAFKRSSNREAREKFNSRHGEDGGNMLTFMNRYAGEDSYIALRTFFERITELDSTQDKWEVDKLMWDVKMIELLEIVDEDDVDLSLLVGAAGWVPIQNVSAGQRCVTVFPLLLRDTRGPLIIDQPEDNLDNRFIADSIGPDLVRQKSMQQFLVTSHNANLVVLGDADLICHIDSDGAKGRVANAGFLACSASKVKDSVLDVLDGGAAALGARQNKYGLGLRLIAPELGKIADKGPK